MDHQTLQVALEVETQAEAASLEEVAQTPRAQAEDSSEPNLPILVEADSLEEETPSKTQVEEAYLEAIQTQEE